TPFDINVCSGKSEGPLGLAVQSDTSRNRDVAVAIINVENAESVGIDKIRREINLAYAVSGQWHLESIGGKQIGRGHKIDFGRGRGCGGNQTQAGIVNLILDLQRK